MNHLRCGLTLVHVLSWFNLLHMSAASLTESVRSQQQSNLTSCPSHEVHQPRSTSALSTAQSVACTIIGSRLDYCNSLYYDMSNTNVQRLHRVQNAAARSTTSTSLSRPTKGSPLSTCARVVNETYDAETETRRPKQRLETFGRDVQAVTIVIRTYTTSTV